MKARKRGQAAATKNVNENGDTVRRALSAHAAIGLLAGALLYLICLSGMLVVVHEEWQRWEQPNISEYEAASPQAAQQAMQSVLAAEAATGAAPTSHLYVHMPSSVLPRIVVTTDRGGTYMDEGGRIEAPEAHSWTEFLLDMHYYLHLPSTLGLIVVGGLGVMMVSLAVTGILAHPRIFRDAFRLRLGGGKRIALTDLHNRLSVWTLPLGIAVSLTGAIIGVSLITGYAVAGTWFGSDQSAVFGPIFGEEAEPGPAAAGAPPMPDIAAALTDIARRAPAVTPAYVVVHDPGTAGQHVQLIGEHDRRLIFGEYYNYDAAGTFQGTAGLADGAVGQQMAASVYNLHFGNYGGLPVKLAYVLLGLALSIVSATGISIWLAKRRQKGLPSERLQGAWSGLVWGAPVLIAGAAALRLLAGPDMPLAALFWLGLLVIIVAGIRYPGGIARAARGALGILSAGIGVLHAALSLSAPPAVLALDAVLLLCGLLFLGAYVRQARGDAAAPTRTAGTPV